VQLNHIKSTKVVREARNPFVNKWSYLKGKPFKNPNKEEALKIKSTIELTKESLKKQPKKAVEKVCSCRLPFEEFNKISKEIQDLGYKNMSQYIREILSTRKLEYNMSELEQYKIFLVNKISNNINQIAKVMHQDRVKNKEVNYFKTNQKLELYLDELYELVGK